MGKIVRWEKSPPRSRMGDFCPLGKKYHFWGGGNQDSAYTTAGFQMGDLCPFGSTPLPSSRMGDCCPLRRNPLLPNGGILTSTHQELNLHFSNEVKQTSLKY